MVCNGKPCDVAAFYDDKKNVIYMDLRFSVVSQPLTQSYLVHEFVHALQYAKYGPYVICDDWLRREREAYRIQKQYLVKVHGIRFPVEKAVDAYSCNTRSVDNDQ
jgi:hypothetical protein